MCFGEAGGGEGEWVWVVLCRVSGLGLRGLGLEISMVKRIRV